MSTSGIELRKRLPDPLIAGGSSSTQTERKRVGEAAATTRTRTTTHSRARSAGNHFAAADLDTLDGSQRQQSSMRLVTQMEQLLDIGIDPNLDTSTITFTELNEHTPHAKLMTFLNSEKPEVNQGRDLDMAMTTE